MHATRLSGSKFTPNAWFLFYLFLFCVFFITSPKPLFPCGQPLRASLNCPSGATKRLYRLLCPSLSQFMQPLGGPCIALFPNDSLLRDWKLMVQYSTVQYQFARTMDQHSPRPCQSRTVPRFRRYLPRFFEKGEHPCAVCLGTCA